MPAIPLFQVFGRSPIRPLQQHMRKGYECCHELIPFFTASMQGDWTTATQVRQKIVDLEHAADSLKRDLRLHLPKGLFMPVQRSDVLELVARQDMVPNRAKDISGIIIGRKMVFPEQLKVLYLEFLQRCVEAAHQAYKTISELDEISEAGFRGKEVQVVEGMVNELHRIEQEADQLEIKVRQVVFELENEMPPVSVIFLYKIIEWTGDIAGYSQRIGDGLQILIAR
ncbi:MAG: TIGR00153 family protein [Gammaproteobacteria bacterium GWE2_42_36]|nr:MAG: TIGR00153 family protein [Gammaproteobacteria bacterium GWE2_42_36]HCU04880.1 TIGR00153 family protein [Coxiellaceae bacterium]